VTVYDQPIALPSPSRLILEGNVDGVTGIVVDGVAGTFAASQIGAGLLAADVSTLARGTYQYRLIRDGVTETTVRQLEVRSGTASYAIVQEIFGYQGTSTTFVSRLEVAGIPANVINFVFKYSVSPSGPFITKTAEATNTAGLFTVFNDDIPTGAYFYRLEDAFGNLLSVGNNTGSFTVKRGSDYITTSLNASLTPVTPLTTYELDVFGKVIHQTRHAQGAATVGDSEVTLYAPSADDQHLYRQYDAYGHVLRSIDAEGKSTFYSYHAAGQVAKEWALVTNADGVGRYLLNQYEYDSLGQQTATVQALDDGSLLRTEADYDAFGSVYKKGTNGGWQEYFDYDAAGRVWRTNQKDGVTRVFLYDLQGQVTAEIQSQGRNLGDRTLYPTANAVAQLATDVERTDTVYDKLGRVVQQIQPSFNPYFDETAIDLKVVTGFVNVGTLTDDGAGTYTLPLEWSTLDTWGSGEVTVAVDYMARDASGTYTLVTAEQAFNAYNAVSGATTSFTLDSLYTFDSVRDIRISKKVNGQNVVVLQSDGIYDAIQTKLFWSAPLQEGMGIKLEYRPGGSSAAWSVVSNDAAGGITVAGGYCSVDISRLVNDQYEYRLSYTRPGESAPYLVGNANFTVSGNYPEPLQQPLGQATGVATSLHTVGWVEEGMVEVLPTTKNNSVYTTPLKWDALTSWGDGEVMVDITYTLRKSSGVSATFSVSQMFDGYDAMSGVSISFPDNGTYPIFVGINNVTVSKIMDGQNVVVRQSATGADTVMPERLVLQGNVSGLTGIVLLDAAGVQVGERLVADGSLVGYGGEVFIADVSGLPRGSYRYVTQGLATVETGSFEARGNADPGRIEVQESSYFVNVTRNGTTVTLDWSPITQWGEGDVTVNVEYLSGSTPDFVSKTYNAAKALSGATFTIGNLSTLTRITVTKKVDGQDVIVRRYDGSDAYASVLEFSGLPDAAAEVTVEYRPLGSNESFQAKQAAPMMSLWDESTVLGNTVNGQYTYSSSYEFTGDFNGDGKADYLWNRNGWNIAYSNGDGFTVQMAALASVVNGVTTHNNGFQYVADFNGDNKSDFLWNQNGGWHIAYSTGNGFTVQNYVLDNIVGNVRTYNGGYQYIGDFNDDGLADFFWNYNGWNIAYSTGTGFTLQTNALPNFIGATRTYSPGYQHVGDFDNDGRTDFLWNYNGWHIAYSNGNGFDTLTNVLDNQLPDGGLTYNGTYQAVADLNADGRSDYLWKNSDGWQVALAKANERGFEAPQKWLGNELPDGKLTYDNANWKIADFTGDGKADYLWKNGSGWRLARSTGSGFEVLEEFPLFNALGDGGATTGGNQMLFADFDGDSKTDYFWKNADGWHLAKVSPRNWHSLDTSDIPSGEYEYRLTVKDINHNVLDLTHLGGTANGTFSSTTRIRHGGQSLPFTTATANLAVTPVVNQTFDRWGNMLTVTDPRNAGWITRYRYDHLNQTTVQIQPQVLSVDEHGVPTRVSSERYFYYDSLGRQVAEKDALDRINAFEYDAAGQRITERHADNARAHYVYDALGRRVAEVDANGNRTDVFFDHNNRIVRRRNDLNETEEFGYDERGQRITTTDGLGNTRRAYYDNRGNLIKSRLAGGHEQYMQYDLWNHKIRESHANLVEENLWTYDYFGKLTAHTDLGGTTHTYQYDYANHLLRQTNSRGQDLSYFYYANGLQKRVVDQGTASGDLTASYNETWYGYDTAGNRTREVYSVYAGASLGFTTHQDAVISFNELGRISRYQDMYAYINYEYDSVGNRRHTHASYINPSDPDAPARTSDNWYVYDAMNRMLVSQGVLRGGAIMVSETSSDDGFNESATWSGLTTLGTNPDRQHFVDMNGDGKADWVSVTSAGNVVVHLYRFDDVTGTSGFADTPVFNSFLSVNAGSNPDRVRLEDVSGDGRKDLVYLPASGETGGVRVYLSDGQGGFVTSSIAFSGLTALAGDPARIKFVDLNPGDNNTAPGSAKVDLVYFPSGGGIRVYRNNGANGFEATPVFTGFGTLSNDPNKFRFADLTGDGQMDLVYMPGSGNARIYLSNGNGGFSTTMAWEGPTNVANPNRLRLVDVNGDQKLDWVMVGDGGTRVFLNDGTGRFSDTPDFSGLKLGDDSSRYIFADVNADGRIDLVHVKSSDGAEIYLNDGRNGFDDKAVWKGLTAVGSDPSRQRLVDVDGDGYLDWIYINGTTGGARLFMHGKPQGVQLSYDAGGNRRTAIEYDDSGKLKTEYYSFDAANRLLNTYRLTRLVDPDTGAITYRQDYTSERYYDAAGRVVKFVTYSAPGEKSSTAITTYDVDGKLLKREQYELNKPKPTYTVDYSAEGAYSPDGRVVRYRVHTSSYDNYYTTTYRAFDTFRQDKEQGKSTYFQSGYTDFVYDVNGNLVKVVDNKNKDNFHRFVNNAVGQFLVKTDSKGKKQYYYYAGGEPLGSHGDLTGADFDFNYTPVGENYPSATPGQYVANEGDTLQTVALMVYGDSRLWYLIADANGLSSSSTLTAGQVLNIPNRITNLYNAASSLDLYDPGMIIGNTTPTLPEPPVEPNEARDFLDYTSRFYSATSIFLPPIPVPGIPIPVPPALIYAGAAKWHHDKRYDRDGRGFLTEVHYMMGDPAKAYWLKHRASNRQVQNSAIILSIVIAVVAAIITVVTWGAGSALAPLWAALIGMLSSVASQTILVGSEVQQGYNWNQVAIAGVSAYITSGIQVQGFGTIGNAMINAGISNVVNQGLNVIFGEQKSFNWASLAMSVIVAGIGAAVGGGKAEAKETEIDFKSSKAISDSMAERAGDITSSASNMIKEVASQLGGRLVSTFALQQYRGKSEWARAAIDSFGNLLGSSLAGAATEFVGATINAITAPEDIDIEIAKYDTFLKKHAATGGRVVGAGDGYTYTEEEYASRILRRVLTGTATNVEKDTLLSISGTNSQRNVGVSSPPTLQRTSVLEGYSSDSQDYENTIQQNADTEKFLSVVAEFIKKREGMAPDERRITAYAPFRSPPPSRLDTIYQESPIPPSLAANEGPQYFLSGDQYIQAIGDPTLMLAHGSMGFWKTHQAFNQWAIRDASDSQLEIYNRATVAADSVQDDAFQFAHVLRIESGGETQSPELVREVANHWLRFTMQLAIEAKDLGRMGDAYFYEGLAFHTIQDRTAFAHWDPKTDEPRVWGDILTKLLHITRDTYNPGPNSQAVIATKEFHYDFFRKGYIPEGDLLSRYGTDVPPSY
jgi:YD repeat-containing protein